MSIPIQLSITRADGVAVGGFFVAGYQFDVRREGVVGAGGPATGTPSLTVRLNPQSGIGKLFELLTGGPALSLTLLENVLLGGSTFGTSKFDFGNAVVKSIVLADDGSWDVTFSVGQYDAVLPLANTSPSNPEYTAVTGFDFRTGAATSKVDGSATIAPGSAAPLLYYIRIDQVAGDTTIGGVGGYFLFDDAFPLALEAFGRPSHAPMSIDLPQSALVALLKAEIGQKAASNARILGVDVDGQVRTDIRLGGVQLSAVSDDARDSVSATVEYRQLGLITYPVDAKGLVSAKADSSFGYDFAAGRTIAATDIAVPAGATGVPVAIAPTEFVLSYQISGEAARHVAIEGFDFRQYSPIGLDGGIGPAALEPLTVALGSSAPADLLAAMAQGRSVAVTVHGSAIVDQRRVEVYTLDLGATTVRDVSNGTVNFAAGRYEIDTYGLVKGSLGVVDHLFYEPGRGSSTLASVALPTSATVIDARDSTDFYLLLDGIPGSETAAGRAGYFKLAEFGLGATEGASGISISELSFAIGSTAFAALFDRSVSDTHVAGARLVGITNGAVTYDLRLSDLDITSVGVDGTSSVRVSADFAKAALATFAPGSGAATGVFSYGVPSGTTSLDAIYSPVETAPRSTVTGDHAYLSIARADGTAVGTIELEGFEFGLIGAQPDGKAQFSSLTVSTSEAMTALMLPLLAGAKDLVMTLRTTIDDGDKRTLVTREFDFGNARLTDLREGSSAALSFDFGRFDVRTTSYRLQDGVEVADYVETYGYDAATGVARPSVASVAPGSDLVGTTSGGAYYLLIEGIPGHENRAGFETWFPLKSFTGLDLSKSSSSGRELSVANVGFVIDSPTAIAAIANLAASGATVGSVRIVRTTVAEKEESAFISADWRFDAATFQAVDYNRSETSRELTVSMSMARFGVETHPKDTPKVSTAFSNGTFDIVAYDDIDTTPTVVALEDRYQIANDKKLQAEAKLGVLANDSSTALREFIAQLVKLPVNGTLTLKPDGSFDFLPTPGFVGEDVFTYIVNGQSGSTPTTVKINVIAPDLSRALDDAGRVNEASVVDLRVLDNDLYNTATITAIDGVAITIGSSVKLASGAKVTLGLNGVVRYDPNHAFDWLVSADIAVRDPRYIATAEDRFVYTQVNGKSATVTMRIDGVDSPGTDQIRAASDGRVAGTVGNDIINLAQAGTHRASAGDGADSVFLGRYMTSSDVIDGGPGNDQLALQGSYVETLSGTNFTAFESLALLGGRVTRLGASGSELLNYNLTLADSFATGGDVFTINANEMVVGETLTIDASAERDTSIWVFAGAAKTTLTGGARSDAFYFGEARFSVDNVIAGGANDASGPGDQLAIRGDYRGRLDFNANTMTGIEMLVLLSASDSRFGTPGAAYGYAIRLDDANIASGKQLYISANTLMSTETVVFDASGETDGHIFYVGGAGVDTVKGGRGADSFFGGLGADVFTGGAGGDRYIYRSIADSTITARDRILDFATGDKIDLSLIDLDATRDGRQGFSFVSGGFTGVAGQLRAIQSGGVWLVEGDANGDGAADFSIALTVSDGHAITAADFIL